MESSSSVSELKNTLFPFKSFRDILFEYGSFDYTILLSKLFEENRSQLINPNPFNFARRSSADRQLIVSGDHKYKPLLTRNLSEDQRKGILNLSDKLDLNEIECLRLWIAASNKEYRRLVGSSDIPKIASELFYTEQIYILDVIFYLMKFRFDTTLATSSPEKYDIVMKLTNNLLVNNLGINLIEAIKNGIFVFRQIALRRDESIDLYNHITKLLHRIAECIFLSFYHTQATQSEANHLIEIIHNLSNALSEDSLGSDSLNSFDQLDEWAMPSYQILVILNLTLNSIWQQSEKLFSRNISDFPYKTDRKLNELEQSAGSMDPLDTTWKSACVKGFTCLIFAIARQVAIKDDPTKFKVDDVFNFLIEACHCRAYSYIRLCVLPVLQILFCGTEEQRMMLGFYMEALKDILLKAVYLFAEYYEYKESEHFLHRVNIDASRAAEPSYDYLDDIIHLYSHSCTIYPSLATELMNSPISSDQIRLHRLSLHLVDACCREQVLELAAIRLLKGLSSDSKFAFYIYAWAAKTKSRRFMDKSVLETFYQNIDDIAIMYGARPLSIFSLSPTHHSAAQALTLARPSMQNRATLNKMQLAYIVSAVQLLTAICYNEDVVDSISKDNARHIDSIFRLLSCPVPIDLKGALFKLLASIATAKAESSIEIWGFLESYNVLPEMAKMDSQASEYDAGRYPCTDGFLSLLEALLSQSWDTSLRLINPDNIGIGSRRPGIVPYIEFLINEVLLKSISKDRHFEPDDVSGEGQRWKLLSKAIKLLTIIVQHYNINSIPKNASLVDLFLNLPKESELFELVRDFRDERVSYSIEVDGVSRSYTDHRAKSSGFAVLSLLLCNSRLFECIIQLLNECNVSNLDLSHIEMVTLMRENSVRLLRKMHPTGRTGRRMAKSLGLSDIGILGDSSCDGAYWRIRMVSNCIGLLYETCLREAAFLTLLSMSNEPLKLILNENGKSSFMPVLIQGNGLGDLLLPNLHLISNLLRFQWKFTSFPSTPVLVARLLEYVAISKPAHKFHTAAGSEDALLIGCIDAVLNGDEWFASDQLQLAILPFGADDQIPFDIFTETSADINKSNIPGESSYSGSIREAVLRMILTTMSPVHHCLAHTLLGLSPELLERCGAPNCDTLVSGAHFSDYIPGMPSNCLEAILDLLFTSDFQMKSPNTARVCFEIMYQLCASPISAVAVIGYLRKPSVNFIAKIFSECKRLLANDNFLVTACENFKANEIKAAIRTCSGWMLKICALDLRSLSFAHQNSSEKKIEMVLRILFDIKDANILSSSNTDGSAPVPCMLAILQANIFGLKDFLSPNLSAIVIDCLTKATIPYAIGRSLEPTMFTIIDISSFNDFVKNINEQEIIRIGRDLISEMEYKSAISVAINYNRHYKELAAASHLCQGWCQVVSISFSSYIEILLSSPGMETGVSSAMQRIADLLILPTMDIIFSPKTDFLLTEQLISVLLVMLDSVRSVSKSVGKLVLSVEHHENILKHLFDGIVKSGRFDQSPEYRSYLYSCISIILHLPDLIDIDSKVSSSAEAIRSDSPIADYTVKYMTTLEPIRPEIIDKIASDACGSNLFARVTAMSALSSILAILGPAFYIKRTDTNFRGNPTMASFSGAYLRVIDVLLQKGYLSKLLLDMSISNADDKSALVLDSIIVLCTHIAGCQEGVDALLDCGILERINNFPVINIPHAISNDLAAADFDNPNSMAESNTYIELKLMPVLNLLRVIASTYPSYDFLEVVALFLNKNFSIVAYLLRLKVKTYRGMEMVDAILSLACMIASTSNIRVMSFNENVLLGDSESKSMLSASSPERVSYNKRKGDHNISLPRSAWDTVLGHRSDSFNSLICDLMNYIGADPYLYRDSFNMGIMQSSSKSFWSQINPSNEVEEMWHLNRCNTSDQSLMETSVFDIKKHTIAVSIVVHSSSFLRIRSFESIKSNGGSNSSSTQKMLSKFNGLSDDSMTFLNKNRNSMIDGGGNLNYSLLAIDFNMICNVLCTILRNVKHMSGEKVAAANMKWMKSSEIILPSPFDENPSREYIAENLMCVIYDMINMSTIHEVQSWSSSINIVVDATDKYPHHSFVGQINRWIRSKQESI